ncbi:uncharacterized protein HMPREF1541_09042 [Cyphellophora europaea CBS 101466]|uniref:Amino acid permease/ SLC12A domain-containing protein n=1 Tax=Cyphellophora europaea (strain CBS 101466) TaxID=1220924 RepID=W2RM03_CYPE1|nr:uncharacterized protein HMPREF1541_09042 [Cyphellophora europaea CBS 101466]ETN36764.1 hypothetical protein HMPREF1541_09042 [Cyphellophora europaea CBS 101466]
MILSMCEETKNPATQVPKAMCGALFLSWLCGFIFLIPLMFVMPAIEEVISDPYGQPLPFILRSAIGSEGGAFALTVPIIVLGIIYGAIPGSGLWKQVNAKLNVPLNAMMLSMAIQILLGLIYFGSYAAFSAFSGSAVIFLTIAYVMPIVASLLGGRKHLSAGSWDFGVIGVICNVISIAWTMFVLPLFSFPFFNPTTLETMNYGSVVFIGGTVVSALWYFVWGRKNYKGPPTQDDEVLRRRSSIIEQ